MTLLLNLIIVLNGIFDAYRSVINATLTQDPPSFFLMTRLAPWMWFFSFHSLFTHQLPKKHLTYVTWRLVMYWQKFVFIYASQTTNKKKILFNLRIVGERR